jgi:nickel-dependent lactate racemase
MQTISMRYGGQVLPFRLPASLKVDVLSPKNLTNAAAPGEPIIVNALNNPIDSPPLKDLVTRGMQVAVLIDDVTRPTPIHLMLPPVLRELEQAGLAKKQIKIVIALGTHRPMNIMEVRARVGSAIASSYTIVNTDCQEKKQFHFKGDTTGGVPAWVNRTVAEAELVIGLGMIVPHTDTGFSGGAKIVLPGVCALETIKAFHALQVDGPPVRLGNEMTPLRLELERFVAEKTLLDFILNVILDGDENIYAAVAGHYVHAHRQGCRIAKTVYGIPVKTTYPIVVTNAYPTQNDLWQSTKALCSAAPITSPGGHLILLTHCREGLGTHTYYAEYIRQSPETLVKLLAGGDPADPVACALAVDISRIKAGLNISVVSSGLSAADVKTMGFAYFKTLENAIQNACEQSGESSVGIITHGGVAWPYVD